MKSGGQRKAIFKFGQPRSAEMVVNSPSKRRRLNSCSDAENISVKKTTGSSPPSPPPLSVWPPTPVSSRLGLRRCPAKEHKPGSSPRRTASQRCTGSTRTRPWSLVLGSGGSVKTLSAKLTEQATQTMLALPPSSGEQPPLTVSIHRGHHLHRYGGEGDQPEGPAAQLFHCPPPTSPDSRIKEIKLKL